MLRAPWVVLFRRGDGTAGGDTGQRRGAGLFAASVSGLPATLAVSGGRRSVWVLEFGMKRGQLIKHLSAHGAFLLREGSPVGRAQDVPDIRSHQSPEPVGQRSAFARPTRKLADALPLFNHPRRNVLLHGRDLSAAGHALRAGGGGFAAVS